MNDFLSADVHQLIHLVLTSAILIFSLIDFFRYQAVTYPILRKNFGLLCAVFFLLITPALNVQLNHYHPFSLVQMIGFGFFQLATGTFLFVAGYVWVRRAPRETFGRRHDLVWKRILNADVNHPTAAYDPRAVSIAVALGLGLALASIAYMQIMDRLYPDYLIRVNANLPRKNLAAWIYLTLTAAFWEEIFYRWYLLHAFKYLFRHFRAGGLCAIVLAAAAFAVGHFDYAEPIWIKEAQTFVIGAILCAMYPLLGIEGCVIAHLTINLAGILSLF